MAVMKHTKQMKGGWGYFNLELKTQSITARKPMQQDLEATSHCTSAAEDENKGWEDHCLYFTAKDTLPTKWSTHS